MVNYGRFRVRFVAKWGIYVNGRINEKKNGATVLFVLKVTLYIYY